MKKRSFAYAVIISAALFLVPQLCFSGQVLDTGYASQSNSLDFNVATDLKIKSGKAVIASNDLDNSNKLDKTLFLASLDVGKSIDSGGSGKFTETKNDNLCASCHSLGNFGLVPDI